MRRFAGAALAAAFAATACTGDDPEARTGAPGESCRARSDCSEGLACVRDVCVPISASFSVTGKDCERVECEGDADCCGDFVPAPDCDFYEMRCEADPMDCAGFRIYCQCNSRCREQLCVDAGPACMADTDCPSFTLPFCAAGRCAECREHGDCPFEGQRCADGRCVTGCAADDECPALQRCEAGGCVPGACSSDRECAFALGDARGRCVDGGCLVACTDDLECDLSRFEVCHEGECRFVGCETDAECRALLGAELEAGGRAACR